MPELSAQLPAIIAEAAKSPLGIFALMIISLAILGFFFFKEATEKTRIGIFSLLFVGVAAFGLSLVRTTSAAAPASDASASAAADTAAAAAAAEADAEAALVKSILGTWTADVVYFRPRSFRETFTFEMLAGELRVTPTFTGSSRAPLQVRIREGAVLFDLPRQEIDRDVTTDVVSSYIGVIHADRIDFTLSHDNGDPTVKFAARRDEPSAP